MGEWVYVQEIFLSSFLHYNIFPIVNRNRRVNKIVCCKWRRICVSSISACKFLGILHMICTP